MRRRSASSWNASSTKPDAVSVRPTCAPTLRPKAQRSGLSTCATTITRPAWNTVRWHDCSVWLTSSRISGNAAAVSALTGLWRCASSNRLSDSE